MATLQTPTATPISSLYFWDFNVGDIFSYGGDTFYVDREPTRTFVFAIRKSDKTGRKVRISALRMPKSEIRQATEAEKAEFATVVEAKKGDDRIVRGATVRIKDAKNATKYGYAPDAVFVVFNSGGKTVSMVPLGGTDSLSYLRFPPSLLEYQPMEADEAIVADGPVRRGATVRIKDAKYAKKYGYAPETVFVVFNEGTKTMSMLPLGGGDTPQYLRFPPSMLKVQAVKNA